ncbi:arsenate reductase [Tahibacter aquaticus]|uniref:Arsenate reductase n=1 Tax=Tahibacter aquaticus TaxID=520092 RepID=A0A4R6YRJ7_9GAMM|nr:ArsC/Spx/MgsR family protein [Tahibacter aquaticus]TDR40735.1 arsenate reductase [Tahibacter aquaticus]
MSDCTVYYNPHCSKCRALLEWLAARGIAAQLIDYQRQPPDAATLARLLHLLGDEAPALLRRDESELAALGIASDSSPIDIVATLVLHPQLMQRPVIVCGERALIARPPQRALEIL